MNVKVSLLLPSLDFQVHSHTSIDWL
jgi:hypothetical protein